MSFPTPRPTTPRGWGSLVELRRDLGQLRKKERREEMSGGSEKEKRNKAENKGKRWGIYRRETGSEHGHCLNAFVLAT